MQQAQEAFQTYFEQPKIIYSHFQSEPLFSVSNNDSYINNKCYLINGADYSLLGLLNSKVIWFLFKSLTTMVRGGFYEATTQNIEKLPIPPATPEQKTQIGELAQRCQTLTEQRYKLENDTRLTIAELG